MLQPGHQVQAEERVGRLRPAAFDNVQLRISAFNLWNWHAFTASGARGTSAFDTDIASPDFGQWNGTVTDPRNIQLSARLEF